ncbi:MAG: hypothetical protein AB8B54_05760 [Sphingorhabdus sp.]
MIPEPPLLIIAPTADEFDLSHLPLGDVANDNISVNCAKFQEMDLVEVIVDAMPFLLSRFTAPETVQKIAIEKCERLFCDPPSPNDCGIGIAPRDNISSAKHMLQVNHRLLLLGKWIGESLGATAAAWMPSRRLANFQYFTESVEEYLVDGSFPALFQTSFLETEDGSLVTTGLRYFSGQEIHLTAPPDYSKTEVTERMVRIIDDMVNHGKIDNPARSDGMVQGETLFFSPREDLQQVDILIQKNRIEE